MKSRNITFQFVTPSYGNVLWKFVAMISFPNSISEADLLQIVDATNYLVFACEFSD
jgi:hypothetical protein